MWRCLRLRCPACGVGPVFRGWFSNHENCSHCDYDFVREPGFYLGSIYVNYGLTGLILVAVCSPIVLLTDTSYAAITPPALIFCVLFPMWFHHYARALWLGFDYRWDGFRSARLVGDEELAQREAEQEELGGPAATCPFCHHRARYAASDDGWVECRKCGQRMLAKK